MPITTAADKEKIKACLDTISGHMTEIEDERDYIKEAVADICEEFDLDKKTFRKMARTYHKQNFKEVVGQNDEFEDLYKSVVG